MNESLLESILSEWKWNQNSKLYHGEGGAYNVRPLTSNLHNFYNLNWINWFVNLQISKIVYYEWEMGCLRHFFLLFLLFKGKISQGGISCTWNLLACRFEKCISRFIEMFVFQSLEQAFLIGQFLCLGNRRQNDLLFAFIVLRWMEFNSNTKFTTET